MALHTSIKHVQVNKAETTMLAVVAVAVIIGIFGLFGIKATLSKAAYQQRVLSQKHKVVVQLKANYVAAQNLVNQYQTFVSDDPNILGGVAAGTGNRDGNNAQIILDALPSKYDAPALASSIEKILNSDSVTIHSIDVKDDPTANPDQPQATPIPVVMSFSFIAAGSYASDQQLFKDFERSIRPFDVTTLQLNGSDTSLLITANMNTYYQPAKSLSLSDVKVVK